MSSELYKRYRPKDFESIVGNASTVEALARMIEKDRIPHTILFSGPSGCGKTTLARILRRKLECHDLDVMEANCAQSRGVDAIRDIQRLMNFAPTGKCRVWILDEAHQLTSEAQNAALKMLEDTPDHVFFFLCTTNPTKLLPTIRTRCAEMKVALLSDDEAISLVKKVCKKESIDLSKEIRTALLDASEGSPRKLLVNLDRIRNLPGDKQEEALKTTEAEMVETIELCRLLIKRASWSAVAKCLRGIKVDPESVRWAVLGYMKNCLLGNGGKQAFFTIQAFSSPFFDSKEAGLVAAAYEAIHGS